MPAININPGNSAGFRPPTQQGNASSFGAPAVTGPYTLPPTTATVFTATGKASGGTSASPAGNISTTETAMGLGLVAGFNITPAFTGRVAVFMSGVALNSTAVGDGTQITGRYGTGTAPSNGATIGLGTAFGAPQHFVASTTAGQQGFCVMGLLSSLTLGTAYWFDLSLLAITGGGATVKDVQIVAMEF